MSPFFTISHALYSVVQCLGFTNAKQHEAKASDASRIGGSVNGGRTPPFSCTTVTAVLPSVRAIAACCLFEPLHDA